MKLTKHVAWLLIFSLVCSSCAVTLEDAKKIQRYKSTKRDVHDILGDPDNTMQYVDREVWVYHNIPPSWPLVFSAFLIGIPYAIYYYIMLDNKTIFRCYFSKAGIVIDKQYEGKEIEVSSEGETMD
jgi:hypothetical protein